MTIEERYPEVAVIDDDAAVLDSFRFMLQAAGVRVVTYPSATDFLASDGTPPRCLILDQNMPHMTGLELVARLRDKGVAVPVLLVTSLVSPSLVAQAAQLGVAHVLAKPPSQDTILGFVAACR